MPKTEPFNELISVIVPIYNVEKYLHKCIDSIINQTYKNLEIILVDDGSPDNCGKICDEYAKIDNRIRVIHKENGGLSDARNAGLDIATGKYVGFVDSDDYIAPEMYEKLYNQIVNDKTDMAACKLDCLGIERNNGSYIVSPEKFLSDMLYGVSACNRLYNRYVWEDIRFPKNKLHEDLFVEHIVVSKCKSISCLPEVLYYYLIRDESIMTKKYSIKRLEAIYAYVQRLEFLLDKHLLTAAEISMQKAINVTVEACYSLDLSTNENRIALKKARKAINKICIKLIFSKISSHYRWHLLIFYLSPKWYDRIFTFYMRIKKAKLKGKIND